MVLLVSLPEVAVMVSVEVPAGVPVDGTCVVPWLQAGSRRSKENIAQKAMIPRMRRRLRPLAVPRPSSAIPGIHSHTA